MAPEKSPAFQFYPKDFLADGNVAGMSLQERGAYITLLCVCWQEQSLPMALNRLANMVGSPLSAFHKLWPAIAPCFVEKDGRYVHPRLEKEREKQDHFRRRQSDKGKASATARQPKGQPESNRGSTGVQPEGQPKPNSPISYLPTPVQSATHSVSARATEPSGTTDEILGKRAAALLETYSRLYAQHRHGARFRRPLGNLEWTEAVEICRTWDDDTLAKLITILLTTDDDWVARTDRGWKVFNARVQWCADRLAEWEAKQRRPA